MVHCYLCARPRFCHVVCLLTTSRRSDSAKTQKRSIYEVFMLAAYGFWQVYICSVKMVLRQQCSSSGSEGLGKGLGEQCSPLWRYNIKADVCSIMLHNPCKISREFYALIKCIRGQWIPGTFLRFFKQSWEQG